MPYDTHNINVYRTLDSLLQLRASRERRSQAPKHCGRRKHTKKRIARYRWGPKPLALALVQWFSRLRCLFSGLGVRFCVPQVHSAVDRGVGGTGLGLAISKSLCESMGGRIGVRSIPGQGSTFHFSVLVGTLASANATSTDDRNGPTPADAPTNDLQSSQDGTIPNLSSASTVLPSSLAAQIPSPGLGNASARARAAPRISQEWGLAAGLRGDSLSGRNDSGPARRHSRYGDAQEEWLGEQTGAADASIAGLNAVTAAASTDDHHQFPTQSEPQRSETATAPGVAADGGHSGEQNVPSGVLHCEHLWARAVEAARASGGGALSPPASMSAGAGGVSRPRILVVDDQRVNRMLVRRMLQSLDVDVELKVDGAKVWHAELCGEGKLLVWRPTGCDFWWLDRFSSLVFGGRFVKVYNCCRY